MSGSGTIYTEQSFLGHTLGFRQMAFPAQVFVGLCSAAMPPSETVHGIEAFGHGYARQPAQFALIDTPANIAANVATVEYPLATGAGWGTLGFFELWDAAAGGNRLYWGALIDTSSQLPITITVSSGDIVRFSAGTLAVQAATGAGGTSSVGAYLPLAGGTLLGPLLLASDPTTYLQAATKQYVDAHSGTGGGPGFLPLSGGTMLGMLTLSGAPTSALHGATKAYVDSGGAAPFLPLSGGTMMGLATLYQTEATGPISHICWPVANAPDPSLGTGNAVRAQTVAQGLTTLDHTYAEWTAVFGNYVNTGQPNGQKVTVYAGAVQGPLGGSTWSFNTNVIRNGIPNNVPGGPGNVGSGAPGTPGAIPVANSTIGYELDFTNFDQDGAIGTGPFTVGLFLTNASIFPSTAGIYYASTPLNAGNNNYGWHDGILFSGQYTIKDNTILDGTHSNVSYQDNGVHAGASYYANDTSPYALQIGGNHATADIFCVDNAPTVLKVTGNHTTIIDASAAVISTAFLHSPGFSVDGSGNLTTGGSTVGVGGVGLTRGDATHPGWLAFYDAAGARLGYIGYNDGGTHITLETEGSYTGYKVLGDLWAGSSLTTMAGPTIRSGIGAASGTQPAGSLWLRTDGAVGSRLYVSAGAGTWAAVAGV